MARRVPIVHAADLSHVERLVADVVGPVTVVFDADNTLVPQGVPVEVFRQGVSGAVARFERLRSVDRVIVLTNGPDRGVPGMIHRGNKPWTTRRRLGLSHGQHVCVVGDQILTDGVLAWRLGAMFFHLAIDVTDEAHRQAVMRRIGALVRWALFTERRPPRA